MDLEADPGIVNFIFLFQIVDNDLADIAPRSYIVGVSSYMVNHVFLPPFFWTCTHTSLRVWVGFLAVIDSTIFRNAAHHAFPVQMRFAMRG